jgi:alpha-beta hydrolase superfamily lysophospholipase
MSVPTAFDSREVAQLLFSHEKQSFRNLGGDPVRFPLRDKFAVQGHFFAGKNDDPVILFFCDRIDYEEDYREIALTFSQLGISFLILERPVGDPAASPLSVAEFLALEQELFPQVLSWLTESGYTGKSFVMAKGLGTVVAIDLASKQEIHGLILESPIVDTASYFKNLGLHNASDLGSDAFGSLEKLTRLTKPTLIFHGANDPNTSIREAEQFQSHCGAKTKQFFIVPGGDEKMLNRRGGDIYYQTIRRFIDTVLGTNTWRQRRKKFNRNKE